MIGLCAILAACTDGKEELTLPGGGQESVPVSVSIQVGSAPMSEPGVVPATRATMPMGPALENPMRTLAVFQFDREGTMLEVNEEETPGVRRYYHFISLTSEDNPSGSVTVTLKDVKLKSSASDITRVCLLANVSQEGMDTLLYDKGKGRQLQWNEFRTSTIPISYKLPPKNAVDSIGHVGNIYMFGYYAGRLTADGNGSPGIPGQAVQVRPLFVSLAHVIARLEMNIRLGDGVTVPQDKKVFFGMYNAKRNAYLFAGAHRYLPTSDDLLHDHISLYPVDRTGMLNQQAEVFYFYMAPHIAYKRENATYFALWCVDDNVTAEMLDADMKKPEGQRSYQFYKILMCNDPTLTGDQPTSEGSYWLNRNSIYRVNLTLTYEEPTRSVTHGAGAEGEYVINLKQLVKPPLRNGMERHS